LVYDSFMYIFVKVHLADISIINPFLSFVKLFNFLVTYDSYEFYL